MEYWGYFPNFYPYYVMEYLSGGSLSQHMDESFSQKCVLRKSGQ
jgi:serine/threonine protein kinase